MGTITHFRLSESDRPKFVKVTYYAKDIEHSSKDIKADTVVGSFKMGVKYPITSLRTELQRGQQ